MKLRDATPTKMATTRRMPVKESAWVGSQDGEGDEKWSQDGQGVEADFVSRSSTRSHHYSSQHPQEVPYCQSRRDYCDCEEITGSECSLDHKIFAYEIREPGNRHCCH